MVPNLGASDHLNSAAHRRFSYRTPKTNRISSVYQKPLSLDLVLTNSQ